MAIPAKSQPSVIRSLSEYSVGQPDSRVTLSTAQAAPNFGAVNAGRQLPTLLIAADVQPFTMIACIGPNATLQITQAVTFSNIPLGVSANQSANVSLSLTQQSATLALGATQTALFQTNISQLTVPISGVSIASQSAIPTATDTNGNKYTSPVLTAGVNYNRFAASLIITAVNVNNVIATLNGANAIAGQVNGALYSTIG